MYCLLRVCHHKSQWACYHSTYCISKSHLAPHLLQLPVTPPTRGMERSACMQQVAVLSMRRCVFCETGGSSDPAEKLIDCPSGLAQKASPLWDRPQLLDGRMVWPSANSNVYTNTRNCSVRRHGESTITRQGSCAGQVLRWDLYRPTGPTRK